MCYFEVANHDYKLPSLFLTAETSANSSNASNATESYGVEKGDSINVSCTIEGNVPAFVRWYHVLNVTQMVGDTSLDVPVSEESKGDSVLFLDGITESDSGIYYCKAFYLDAEMIMKNIEVLYLGKN